ncbi:hemerythrin domain-containing protein [Streptomyces oryzae]|uniref:Hemerythrin domain-containing protein n=1 Tax=Streptomyces oryzae TaxID=1434886 RepID=A0ABS3XIU9_9ACTN|nr:hemerythrin domain-containing protein [Streptomyces oryzae]MBO8195265.1 hemerythrin domain-containing protein [Streptomyces oryzae]
MDAIELLTHDHRMVEQLFRDYRGAASARQRRAVVETVIRELSKHAAVEELLVYPLARKVMADGQQEIDEQLAEHMGVKKTLLALDQLPTADRHSDTYPDGHRGGEGDEQVFERTDRLMDELQREVEEHVAEEEGLMFPKLRAALDQQTLDELADELKKAKIAAPSRPHPHAPDQPPALAMAAPVAGVYDRLRDRLQGRPRT